MASQAVERARQWLLSTAVKDGSTICELVLDLVAEIERLEREKGEQ